jgi:serine/threonine protein phosphatase PrpC
VTSVRPTWATRSGARTDRGRVRTHNEDAFLVRPPLFCVADGIGGQAAGQVASATVAETIAELVSREPAQPADIGRMLVAANARLRSRSSADPALRGMGSTCTLALVTHELHIAHVGDSRLYRLRDGVLQRLTSDHTLVAQLVEAGHVTAEQALTDSGRHVLFRALGASDHVDVDQTRHDLKSGDRLLICSDGLTGMIRDDTLRDLLLAVADPQHAVDALVDAANLAGGEDNITAVVVDVADRAGG